MKVTMNEKIVYLVSPRMAKSERASFAVYLTRAGAYVKRVMSAAGR